FLYDRLSESGDGDSDEDRVVERLSQDDIVTALSVVPHDFRDVLVLVDLGDFSYADTAPILDLPLGTHASDPRHPGRHGDVEAPPRPSHPEAGARRVSLGGGDMTDPCAHC